jgi:hypothetical protein
VRDSVTNKPFAEEPVHQTLGLHLYERENLSNLTIQLNNSARIVTIQLVSGALEAGAS